MTDPQQYDVFLSYNGEDRRAARRLADVLKKRGLAVWIDVYELRPGGEWQEDLENIIANCKSAAVCVGPNGVGPWEERETSALLRRFVKGKKKGREVRVIPVLLPKAPRTINLPAFLEALTWVDLRKGLRKAGLDKLQWGITGQTPLRQERIATPLLAFPGKPVPAMRHLLADLRRSMTTGDLVHSRVAPIVMTVLSREDGLQPVSGYDPLWMTTGIRLSDEYFVRVRESAGCRDWQRDFPQTVAPALIGTVRSFQQSADAQAMAIRLCRAVARQLRLRLIWPGDPDQFNDLTNGIYRACLHATELESVEVLVQLKGLTVRGPE